MFTENAKQRRAAEREGRRSRRRRQRERTEQASTHHDGLSTDDEETESEIVKFRTESGERNMICSFCATQPRRILEFRL